MTQSSRQKSSAAAGRSESMATKTVVTATKATTRILLSEMLTGAVTKKLHFVSFISEKIMYLDVDHGRSWHLHVLENKPDQPEARIDSFF